MEIIYFLLVYIDGLPVSVNECPQMVTGACDPPPFHSLPYNTTVVPKCRKLWVVQHRK